MQMVPVDSSWIKAVGHDAGANELHVELKSGKTYVYEKVPPGKHVAMVGSESAGDYLNTHIKGAHAHRLR